MARKKSSSGISTNPVPNGMSSRVMKRKKPINLDYIKDIQPLTENQSTFFDSYKEDKNVVLKMSLIAMYALNDNADLVA